MAVAVVAAALIGVAAAQFVAQTQTPQAVAAQVTAPQYNGGEYPYCYNSTTGEPIWAQNGTVAGPGYAYGYGYGPGCVGYEDGYGLGAQAQNQYGYGPGFTGRSGFGGCWR